MCPAQDVKRSDNDEQEHEHGADVGRVRNTAEPKDASAQKRQHNPYAPVLPINTPLTDDEIRNNIRLAKMNDKIRVRWRYRHDSPAADPVHTWSGTITHAGRNASIDYEVDGIIIEGILPCHDIDVFHIDHRQTQRHPERYQRQLHAPRCNTRHER